MGPWSSLTGSPGALLRAGSALTAARAAVDMNRVCCPEEQARPAGVCFRPGAAGEAERRLQSRRGDDAGPALTARA